MFQGFDCRLIEKDLYHWEVKIYNSLDQECQLYNDLELYSLKTGINFIRIHIQFDNNYPLSPPKIRIVEPRFRPFSTSHVLTGGTFKSNTLNPNLDVWSPINTVESIVQEIKTILSQENASIYYDICAPYTEEEAYADIHGYYKTLRAKCIDNYSDIEEESLGGRVILPQSALQEIINLENTHFPLIFEISSETYKTKIHAGVKDFNAPEGYILMPRWIMDNIQIDNDYPVYVRTVTLTKGTYTKLQPVDKNFLELEQPKEVLETTLRSYLTLQTGQFVKIFFENESYILNVIETKPANVIDILNTDLEVDFDFSMISDQVKELSQSKVDEDKEEKKEDTGFIIDDTTNVETKLCDNCKKNVPITSFETHSLFCMRNNMLCEICGQLIRKSEKQAHHDEFHKEMKCACGQMVEFYLLSEHKKNECPLRVVKCKYCLLNVKYKDLLQHEKACGSRTEKCEKCNRYIMISDLENHTNCVAKEEEKESLSKRFFKFIGIGIT